MLAGDAARISLAMLLVFGSAKLLAPPFIKLAYAGIAKSPPEEEEVFRIG